MASVADDRDRKIIPRWRPLRNTLRLGELSCPPGLIPAAQTAVPYLQERIREWREHRSLSYAADLLSCAVVLGRESDARDAAEFILQCNPPAPSPAQDLARRALGHPDPPSKEAPSDQADLQMHLRRRVHELRICLALDPRNALMWTDLARVHESLGSRDKATRAAQLALSIAPENRFVLRSAARLFVHQDEYRRAHDLLRASRAAVADPWVLAAEIAVASAAGRTSRLIKTARTMIDDRRFGPFHLSELASALGTLECEHGNRKQGRRFMGQSLVKPTENAVAQAAWLARQYGCTEVGASAPAERQSNEATAWACRRSGDWHRALEEANRWLSDQPFSSRPAIFGSFIACTCLNACEEGARIARFGLTANPSDFTLLNNAAFALAQLNDIAEGRRFFTRIDQSSLTPAERVVWLATSGLIEYRGGNPGPGSSRYLEAIELASKQRDLHRRALAMAYLALEKARVGDKDARGCRVAAADAMRSVPLPEFEPLLGRLLRG